MSFVQPEYEGYHNTNDIEFDDITMKTKLVVRSGIIAKRFDGKSFSTTILGFSPRWDYKHYKEYFSEKIVNLISTNRIILKCDAIDGSVVNCLKEPLLISFVLDKPARYNVFCEPEMINYKKIIENVLNTVTFCLQDDKSKEVDFNQKILTFTSQLIKI